MKLRNSRRGNPAGKLLSGRFSVDLSARRVVQVELPEFLICALQARVAEANEGAPPHERCSVHDLIESELVSLVSVRDIAELEQLLPGFAHAVERWLSELRE
jgi:hypothetical protein